MIPLHKQGSRETYTLAHHDQELFVATQCKDIEDILTREAGFGKLGGNNRKELPSTQLQCHTSLNIVWHRGHTREETGQPSNDATLSMRYTMPRRRRVLARVPAGFEKSSR
jgi:predicted GIY-YIG superfamily endonuclease